MEDVVNEDNTGSLNTNANADIETDSSTNPSRSDGGKMAHTRFSMSQIRELEAALAGGCDSTAKNKEWRERLANNMSATERRIKIWFANHRNLKEALQSRTTSASSGSTSTSASLTSSSATPTPTAPVASQSPPQTLSLAIIADGGLGASGYAATTNSNTNTNTNGGSYTYSYSDVDSNEATAVYDPLLGLYKPTPTPVRARSDSGGAGIRVSASSSAKRIIELNNSVLAPGAVTEIRLDTFRAAPTRFMSDRIARVKSTRLQLLARRQVNAHHAEFRVVHSKVSAILCAIKQRPVCECADWDRGKNCKHLVLRVSIDSPLLYQKSLLASELEEIFAQGKNFDPMLSYANKNLPKQVPVVRARLAVAPCPICFDEFEQPITPDIEWCKYSCGSNYHTKCFEQWKKVASKYLLLIRCQTCGHPLSYNDQVTNLSIQAEILKLNPHIQATSHSQIKIERPSKTKRPRLDINSVNTISNVQIQFRDTITNVPVSANIYSQHQPLTIRQNSLDALPANQFNQIPQSPFNSLPPNDQTTSIGSWLQATGGPNVVLSQFSIPQSIQQPYENSLQHQQQQHQNLLIFSHQQQQLQQQKHYNHQQHQQQPQFCPEQNQINTVNSTQEEATILAFAADVVSGSASGNLDLVGENLMDINRTVVNHNSSTSSSVASAAVRTASVLNLNNDPLGSMMLHNISATLPMLSGNWDDL
ncbi:hypothetical protein HK100_004130 [Physocladia obscura]|uniref:SWIM-type domain-containing protein n=1 Tax=Physocladia obscura TaxID=109957 RepID=A0AAD5XD65_9FUNG|nr:hypothetical protein HK100_004130 [Physocladia obscura]